MTPEGLQNGKIPENRTKNKQKVFVSYYIHGLWQIPNALL